VKAWGRYKHGQLGDGRAGIAPDTEDPYADATPDFVVGPDGTGMLQDVVAIAAGLEHSLALLADGTVMGWGNGWPGQLGRGDGSSSSVPRPVLGIPPAVAISAGTWHTLVVDEDGGLWCFGWNNQGQCGNNATGNEILDPIRVLGPGGTGLLTDVVAASGGWQHSIALKEDGSVWCFGYNGSGQCGLGNKETPKLTPVQVKGFGGSGTLVASRIDAGFFHNTATTAAAGTLVAWGSNYYGQLAVAGVAASMGGVGDRTTVESVKTSTNATITNVKTWAAGADHVVVLRTTAATLAWGENSDGECGDGTTTTDYVPAAISGL
jgi:alpha-tubulin suppressor-like RCC1 family protein